MKKPRCKRKFSWGQRTVKKSLSGTAAVCIVFIFIPQRHSGCGSFDARSRQIRDIFFYFFIFITTLSIASSMEETCYIYIAGLFLRNNK